MSYNTVMLDIICHFWMSFSSFYLTCFLIRQATFLKDDLDWTKLQSDQSVYANLRAAQCLLRKVGWQCRFRSTCKSFNFTRPQFSTPLLKLLFYFNPELASVVSDCHTGRLHICTLKGFCCVWVQPLAQCANSCRTTLSKGLYESIAPY